MATWEQEKKFGSEILDQMIEWIKTHCDPQEVFDQEQLCRWANGDHATIEELIPESQLEEWALDNGFIKDPEQA